jgi:hypothetical protein
VSEASRTQELEEHLQRLLKLLQSTERLHNTLDLEKALMMVLDTSLELTGMQRGFIMLLNQERKLEFRIGRNSSAKNIAFEKFKVSQTMMRKVLD